MDLTTQEEAVELLIKALPDPKGLTNFNFREPSVVRFDYEGNRYRFGFKYFLLEKVENGLLSICDPEADKLRDFLKTAFKNLQDGKA